MDQLGRRAEDPLIQGLLLAAAIGVATFLRFDGLGRPSYWLDEILGQNLTKKAMATVWWRWFAGFAEEHGPLYYATQVATRSFGSTEAAGRLAPALFGIATVAIVWFAARAMEGRDSIVAPVSAILLAVSPVHVYYSREARPYALLAFLTAVLVLLLLRVPHIVPIGIVLLLITYTSAVAAPVAAAAVVIAIALRRWTIAAIASAALVLVPLLYRTTTGVAERPGFPHLDGAFFMALLRTFSVSALGARIGGRTAVAMLVFAVIGAVALSRRNREAAIILVGMTVVPLTITLAALRAFGHWYSVRYVSSSLIGYVLLAGAGISAVAQLANRASLVAGVVIAAAIAAQGWMPARTEPFRKVDWSAIASTIWRYAHREDVIVAVEPWSEVPLRYYLGRLPKRATLEGVPYAPVAEALVGTHPATWLVSAGFSDSAVRSWMCRYPMVLASPLENFRMHYASATGDFLRERGGPAEQRALAAALGPHFIIDMAAAENRFLEGGWADPEGFRWATGTRASVAFPRWGPHDRVIRMRVLPLDHPSLPPQTVRASLNGKPFGEITLNPGWSERALFAPSSIWSNGVNTLTFDFGRAAAPADLDRSASDHRPLAVAFAWIAIEDGGTTLPLSNRRSYSIRIASGPYIDEKSAWRNSRSRFPAERLRQDGVSALLGRLGFDPLTAWPRLVSGEVRLDDMIETLAYGGDCEDDRAFLQRAFAVLLERLPEPAEERELRPLAAASRVRVVGRMIKSGEFRRRVLLDQPSNARSRSGSAVGS